MELMNKLRRLMIELDPFHHLLKPSKALKRKMTSKKHYAGDMHVHPNYLGYKGIDGMGEGINTIEEIIERAEKMEIKVIGYTPHFKMHNVKQTLYYSDEIIIIPGVEISTKWDWKHRIRGGHVLVHAYGVNERNADKVELLSRTLQQNHSTLQQLLKIQYKFNSGCKRINGYSIPECVRQNVKMTVTPAHYKDWRGVGTKSILRLYEQGYDLTSLETTNATSNIFQSNLGEILRKEYGKRAPADIGGSDAHRMEVVGLGYTSFTRPKHKINDSLDIFDCIENKDTTTNYLRIGKTRRIVMSKAQYLNVFYWVKFFPWLLWR